MKLFSSLFGNASPPTVPNQTSPEAEPPPPLEHYLALAIRSSRVLTPRGEAVVADYLRQFAQAPGLQVDPGQARAKEEADPALNIRAAELLRAPLSPRRTLAVFAGELHRHAMLQKARHDAVLNMREFCSEMALTLANTGVECAWCRENEGRRYSVHDDPNALLDQHCSCAPYSSTTFYPVIKALDA